jgi:hypothetical protein
MRSRIVAALFGLLLAYAFVISLSLASGFFLSTARLEAVLKEEFSQSALGSLSRFDQWIECAILTMQLSRHEDVVLNALDTRWRSPQQHTCDEVQALLQGPPYKIKIAEPSSYVSYPFGARHLQSLMINIFSFSTTMAIYQLLTYASVVSLFIGAWRNSKRTASLVVSPIALALLFAFEQHRFGSNTPWAPGFFISFLILSMFLAVRELFWQRETHRIALFCFLGTIAGYFDNLHGPLPVVLSLTIVLNHFFYSENGTWISALRSASIISACFVISYGLLTIIRLWPLGWLLSDPVWMKFFFGLNSRMASSAGERTIQITDLVHALWSERAQMTGSAFISEVLLCIGILTWSFTIVMVVLAALGKLTWPAAKYTGIFVLAVATGGILLWYVLFPNHTLGHAWMMVRMLALPIAYGYAAFALAMFGRPQP